MKKIICLVLALTLAAFCFVSCGETPATEPENEEKIDKNLEINVTVLSGTTGMGAAKMIADTEAGNSKLNYKFTVISDATKISAGIIGGTIDIAAAPTNLASTLYKKTSGGVRVLAINTLGVLYLLENGESINSVADLRGKTIYLPGEGTNPEYILKYILKRNGLKVGENVNFDYTYNTPDTLAEAVSGGLCDIALLPEPKVTATKNKNENVRTALDITAEFDKVAPEGSLVQGCIIARTEFVENHPDEIKVFLEEYKKSIEYTSENPEDAAEKIAETGIVPNAALALKALPNCNIVYLDGAKMKDALASFYTALYSIEPKSIGGEMPENKLYYTP